MAAPKSRFSTNATEPGSHWLHSPMDTTPVLAKLLLRKGDRIQARSIPPSPINPRRAHASNSGEAKTLPCPPAIPTLLRRNLLTCSRWGLSGRVSTPCFLCLGFLHFQFRCCELLSCLFVFLRRLPSRCFDSAPLSLFSHPLLFHLRVCSLRLPFAPVPCAPVSHFYSP